MALKELSLEKALKEMSFEKVNLMDGQTDKRTTDKKWSL